MNDRPTRRVVAAYALLITAVIVPRALHARAALAAADADTPFATEVAAAARAAADRGYVGDVYPGVEGRSAHVAPLYAYLLAGVFAVAGFATPAAAGLAAGGAVVATAGWVALLPGLARRLAGAAGPGWAAAWVYALYPGFYHHDSRGDWEHPLATLLALGTVAAGRAFGPAADATPKRGLAAGPLLGVTALTSPAAATGAGLAVAVAGVAAGRRGVAYLGAAAATATLVVVPWVWRNAEAFGRFVPVRGNAGLELAVGNRDGADGRTPHVTADAVAAGAVPAHPFVDPAEAARVRSLGEPAYMVSRRREAVAWIAAHPSDFAALTAARGRLFWFPPPDLCGPDPRLAGPTAFLLAVSAGLAAVGLVVVARRSRPPAVAAALFLLGASGPYLVTHVTLRYRYPVSGLTLVLAATAVAAVVRPRPYNAGRPDPHPGT